MTEAIIGAISGGGFSAIVIAIIYWRRFKKKDQADVNKVDATSFESLSKSY